MSFLAALPILVVLGSAPAKTSKVDPVPWEQVTDDDGVTVLARARPNSDVHEMKAQGVIDAPPEAVWKVLRDYAHYKENMPYTVVSKVISSEQNGKVIYFYSVIDAPFVSKRDYVIKLLDQSKWKDGKGYLKVSWSASKDKGPKATEDIVRVKLNDGYWMLQPIAKGAKTWAVYYLDTDPGGSIPKWLVNKANGSAVPKVFEAVRKLAAKVATKK